MNANTCTNEIIHTFIKKQRLSDHISPVKPLDQKQKIQIYPTLTFDSKVTLGIWNVC